MESSGNPKQLFPQFILPFLSQISYYTLINISVGKQNKANSRNNQTFLEESFLEHQEKKKKDSGAGK